MKARDYPPSRSWKGLTTSPIVLDRGSRNWGNYLAMDVPLRLTAQIRGFVIFLCLYPRAATRRQAMA
jgi:hypothetical protein